MLKLLDRISTVIRLSRTGRGEDLDRVMNAMKEGARFEGAVGEMLLTLMPYRRNGWLELSLRGGDQHRSKEELRDIGRAWARRVQRHIKATRHHYRSGDE